MDAYDPATAQELRHSYPLFPEIHPYWSADLRTVAFYLELGSRIPPATLVARLEELQRTLEAEGSPSETMFAYRESRIDSAVHDPDKL